MWRSVAALVALGVIATVVGAAAVRGTDEPQTKTKPREGPPRELGFRDVAAAVGLDFRHGAFRFGVSADPVAMVGGGVCWLDYDDDGWLDLFVVNGYGEQERDEWLAAGGLPTSRLYRNAGGHFEDVTEATGAGIATRGQGCVAADLDADGDTDLFLTSGEYTELLWNDGDGGFVAGAEDAGVKVFGWHTGAAAGDLNGDGLPELVVTGYVDLNTRTESPTLGFPNTHRGRRDLLFLNEGGGRFREVGEVAGLEVVQFAYGLGVVLSDLDHDGDLDAYVANDTNPNRLYENVAWPGGVAADPARLGFRLEERAAAAGAADEGSGMGVAPGDYDGDGWTDLFVTNARRQVHAAYRSKRAGEQAAYDDVRAALGPSFRGSTGWGATWADLDLDTDADLIVANGDIPVADVVDDAERVEVFVQTSPGRFVRRPIPQLRPLLARGSAAADYDNDGDLDFAVVALGGRLALLENTGTRGNWLTLEADAIGVEVTAVLPDGRRLRREVRAGGSYLSSEDPRAHFGLGRARSVRELLVRWPGGGESRLRDVGANQIVSVARESHATREESAASSHLTAGCKRMNLGGRSVARVWNETLLAAIRRDVPAPTVHARNLFHLSAAMWDAWAAYDRRADGYLVHEKRVAADVRAAREAAISYAAYRILLHRYSLAAGLDRTFSDLTATMRSLCYRIDYTSVSGDSPAALGNRIAAAVIAYGRNDGAHERLRYADPGHAPRNDPLVVAGGGATMRDPSRWQPLALNRIVTQNGIAIPGKVQTFVGSHWGRVRGFALPSASAWTTVDPAPPPRFGDGAFVRAALDVIRKSAELDARDRTVVDSSPRARGDNALGRNDGDGHARNPVTGERYAANHVRRADFARALAEFWADGPESETPPGHWNVVANEVGDAEQARRAVRDRLEWDVKLYFALNGAVHDAAVAAWGVKRAYETARPISMIRYLGAKRLLPRVSGLVEVRRGDVFVRSWTYDRSVAWVPATQWTPYQKPTFVTPAFAGYVSGHSTFSRAAAEVLTAYTGTPYFPGGMFETTIDELANERGPTRPVRLQWATYFDAADDAGVSRLYGGIHIAADDLAGRRLGAACGKHAWARAQRYFDGAKS